MRYPPGHKETVRARIVASATRALRGRGISGISIPALMKNVGLTHGGFYAHFENRDALVAAAIEAAATETGENIFAKDRSLAETLRLYLSQEHVAKPEEGCVLAALGPEGSRDGPAVRRAFRHVATGLLRLVERKLHPKRRTHELSDEALRLCSTMVGAVVLARLVDDPELADRILAAARRSVEA